MGKLLPPELRRLVVTHADEVMAAARLRGVSAFRFAL